MCRRLLCILVFLFYVILEKLEFRLKYLLVVITACPSVPVAAGVIVFIITVLVVGPLRTSASWRTTGGGGRLICPSSSCVVIGSCCCGGGRGCGSGIISQKCHTAGSIGRWPNTVVVRGDVFNRASWPAGRVRLTWKISSFTKLKISFQVLKATWVPDSNPWWCWFLCKVLQKKSISCYWGFHWSHGPCSSCGQFREQQSNQLSYGLIYILT